MVVLSRELTRSRTTFLPPIADLLLGTVLAVLGQDGRLPRLLFGNCEMVVKASSCV